MSAVGKEIIFTCAYPGAGKSTLVQDEKYRGHTRLNRDTIGCPALEDVAKILVQEIRKGKEKFILDNTYGRKEQRKLLVDISREFNIPIKCLWLKTSIEDAMVNVCQRMVANHGKVLTPAEMKLNKDDPGAFPISVLYGYRKQFEEPSEEEGFKLDEIPFVRRPRVGYCKKAIIVDYDGTLREAHNEYGYPTKPEEIHILPGRAAKLLEFKDWLILGVSNQSGVAKGVITWEQAHDLFMETNLRLGIPILFKFCPHSVPPISCYCRKPGPGLGVELIEQFKLDPSKCIMVGDQTTDKTFAARCGFKFERQEDFFK